MPILRSFFPYTAIPNVIPCSPCCDQCNDNQLSTMGCCMTCRTCFFQFADQLAGVLPKRSDVGCDSGLCCLINQFFQYFGCPAVLFSDLLALYPLSVGFVILRFHVRVSFSFFVLTFRTIGLAHSPPGSPVFVLRGTVKDKSRSECSRVLAGGSCVSVMSRISRSSSPRSCAVVVDVPSQRFGQEHK